MLTISQIQSIISFVSPFTLLYYFFFSFILLYCSTGAFLCYVYTVRCGAKIKRKLCEQVLSEKSQAKPTLSVITVYMGFVSFLPSIYFLAFFYFILVWKSYNYIVLDGFFFNSCFLVNICASQTMKNKSMRQIIYLFIQLKSNEKMRQKEQDAKQMIAATVKTFYYSFDT